MTSRAAQAVYGEHLVRISELIPALLYGHIMDRKDLAVAHEQGDQDRVLSAVGLQVMEYRDELLETAVALDVLALCHPPGGYLPWPYKEEPGGPEEGDELRTDASSVASHLAEHRPAPRHEPQRRHPAAVAGRLHGDGARRCTRVRPPGVAGPRRPKRVLTPVSPRPSG
ncbi:hypothetical protein AQJ46_42020 [Streptomyces canus]|uniref:Uncharacterized protein n=1 Tax=Streptomyces canus TaxID=58343 RepID=A0A101RNE0_9ACTN|nr:hypothetical protein AQJ46_42020 [Streptomyces canus]